MGKRAIKKKVGKGKDGHMMPGMPPKKMLMKGKKKGH